MAHLINPVRPMIPGLVATLSAYGSNLTRVEPSSVEVHVADHDLHLKVELNEKKELSQMVIRFGDKAVAVPKEELSGFGDRFDLAKIRIMVRTLDPTRPLAKELEAVGHIDPLWNLHDQLSRRI